MREIAKIMFKTENLEFAKEFIKSETSMELFLGMTPEIK
jgi:hypothetical protein